MDQIVDLRPHLDTEEVRALIDQLEYPMDGRKEKTDEVLLEYHRHQSLSGLINVDFWD